MRVKNLLFITAILLLFLSCNNKNKTDLFIPKDIVIAHRGSTYWAPEETESAYRWARNIGADYLEVDIQRTKDGVLLALHDQDLTRTTNIENIYPLRVENYSSDFTYEEILKLDAGSWFNVANPDKARLGFTPNKNAVYVVDHPAISFLASGEIYVHPQYNNRAYIGGLQYISTLEDVIRIAEGYCIARDALGNRLYNKITTNGEVEYQFFYIKDPQDKGHRPGIYIETKEPKLFSGIERDLFYCLDRLSWNILTKEESSSEHFVDKKVNLGNTSAKVILQTFSLKSLKILQEEFKGKIPTTLLLWLGDDNMLVNDSITYWDNLRKAHQYGAHIIGPSIAGRPNNYADLLNAKNYRWIRDSGFIIHPYSFDTKAQAMEYGALCEGMFTNRADATLNYYNSIGKRHLIITASASKELDYLKY